MKVSSCLMLDYKCYRLVFVGRTRNLKNLKNPNKKQSLLLHDQSVKSVRAQTDTGNSQKPAKRGLAKGGDPNSE